ncbi:DMT family transporter [Salaquimonas pukyongi]|uniref:DMT family transporter n=1 Tax=Salaquimonas pukyongi TaxID=2712698 RepID=UPI0009FB3B57|nr:DMT family transporter [Salaquimonas pukyongi]
MTGKQFSPKKPPNGMPSRGPARPLTGTLAAGPTLPESGPQADNRATVTSAIILMVIAMTIVPLMDVISKYLSTRHAISPVTITWARFSGQAILMLFFIVLRMGLSGVSGTNNLVNFVRGMLIGGAVSVFFIAIKYLPLAEAIATFFVEPLIVLQLSALFLGEKVGWRRNLAALVGFGGALLIIQPTYAIFGPTALLPLVTALLFSIYLILSRVVGQKENPYTMQFWSGLGGVATCSAFLVAGQWAGISDFVLTAPSSLEPFLWLIAIIIIATFSHLLIIIAFSRAEASILAPFQYLEIATITVAGYFVFGEFPTPLRWLGIFIIIASGLYIFLRERRLKG